MCAFQNGEIENLSTLEYPKVYRFAAFALERFENGAADLADGCPIGADGTEANQARSEKIGTGAVTHEIAGLLQMSKEAVRGAFVELGLLSDVAKLKAIRRVIEQLEYREDLSKNTHRCRICSTHSHPDRTWGSEDGPS